MTLEEATRIVLSFVILIIVLSIISVIFVGCSDNQPSRVAWLSVEKPPIKIVYIDKQGNLDPVITTKVFNIVGKTSYKNFKLNENTNVSLSSESHQVDIESDKDIALGTLGIMK